ncbi:MAG: hypothetical protein R3B45_07440 [Bdellovibrionota bacterium]
MRPQIEARERRLEENRKKAAIAFDRMMGKVQIFLADGNTHSAYKTVTYFAGQYEQNLSPELLVTAASEAVRIGIKAKTNIQELGKWLHKGVATAMSSQAREGIEESLDLIDAYGEYFYQKTLAKGLCCLGIY